MGKSIPTHKMFSAVVKNANGSATGLAETMHGVDKRSTVCDADANGRVNPNCRR